MISVVLSRLFCEKLLRLNYNTQQYTAYAVNFKGLWKIFTIIYGLLQFHQGYDKSNNVLFLKIDFHNEENFHSYIMRLKYVTLTDE
ncbi:MAG: hypothetical protein KatS3mg028_1379 [Bacteroidia bacterium]|jgi:hypothetical protein|nr:MAG: hypothetical protein KatS3mg028_1379 [Bacteroidia bacterium]